MAQKFSDQLYPNQKAIKKNDSQRFRGVYRSQFEHLIDFGLFVRRAEFVSKRYRYRKYFERRNARISSKQND